MASSYPAYGAPPPAQYPYPPSTNYNTSSNTFNQKSDDARRISRTPSPTPSEEEELMRDSVFDWKALMNWRYWVRREWLWYYVIGGVILIITILISVFHTQIVHALTPATNWMHNLSVGWLIPIAVLFIISFPPLFGHEIVAILCGLVWGLWVGFAIVAAGTLLGELGNFYAFKYCCHARGEKLEKDKIAYACLAKIVRDGGFKIALIARLSVLPGHFTTAIFATCGMGVITFTIAAILSMPKQFITVYLGVILEQSGTGAENSKNKLISDVVLGLTILVTAVAMWYILRKMKQAKPDVIYARRKARQGKLERADFTPYGNSTNDSSNSVIFNPQSSETDIPLNPSDAPYDGAAPHQQWDKHGRAVGFTGDPRVHAPQPQRAQNRVPTYRTEGGGGYNASGQRYDDRETGTTYSPGNADVGGRSPLRQESGESVGWDTNRDAGARETFELPRITASPPQIASPTGIHSPLDNPFEAARQPTYPIIPGPPKSVAPAALTFSAPAGPPPPQISPLPTQPQFANYPTPTTSAGVTSPPLPNPYASATPTQSSHPQVPYSGHAPEATDASFYTADVHSRTATENAPQDPGRISSPPPPSYHADSTLR